MIISVRPDKRGTVFGVLVRLWFLDDGIRIRHRPRKGVLVDELITGKP